MTLKSKSARVKASRLSSAGVSVDLQLDIERFLYMEAEFLDDREFEAWCDLMAHDIEYFVPIRENRMPGDESQSVRPLSEGAHIYEVKAGLQNRVEKLKLKYNWSEYPATRHRRFVTNIRVLPTQKSDEFDVRSNLHIFRSRMNDEGDSIYGERRDVIRVAGNELGFVVAKRTVILDNALIYALATTTII